MGGRYIITGTQIGQIKAYLKERRPSLVSKVLNTVYEDQFVGDSQSLLSDDMKYLEDSFNSKQYERAMANTVKEKE